MSFLGEIKRRKIFQVAAVYALVAWLAVQIVVTVEAPLSLPDWVDTLVILLLAIGFPITLIISWAFNLTPEGLVPDEGGAAAAPNRGRRIEYVLFGLLVIAVGWIGYNELRPSGQTAPQLLPNSVAVLPFENLSSDPENAFFAPGIHDTILNELAKIADINVIARTSVLRYANGQTPVSQIAKELNVETVMEGTVQFAEGDVRITAQLIDPMTGAHLWSKNYDRDFANIFAIQSEIAQSIAMALEAKLLPSERESIEERPTNSTDAYVLYLKAMEMYWGAAEPTALPVVRETALAYLSQAIELDPNFALAYARIAWLHFFTLFEPAPEQDWMSRREEISQLVVDNVKKALELDPSLGLAHAALGRLYTKTGRADEGEEEYKKALALSPKDPEVLINYSFLGWARDDLRAKTLPLAEAAVELDPNNDDSHFSLGQQLFSVGEYERASAAFRRGVEVAPTYSTAYIALARSEIGLGNLDNALQQLRIAESLMPPETVSLLRAELGWVYGRLGLAEDAKRIFAELESLAEDRYIGPDVWAIGYLGMRDETRALQKFNEAIENPALVGDPLSLELLKMNAYLDPILDKPDFIEIRANVGF